MLGAGVASGAVAEGSPVVFVGVAGFGIWVVWLVAIGFRLLRTRPAHRSGQATVLSGVA